MKTVLGIAGSPRKGGNTEILVSRVLAGAAAQGATVDLVRLAELKISECDGCHACWKGRGCSKKDDMLSLYPKIVSCDAIVFGTPVYWYGPTALMKAFVDRLVYFNCPKNRALIRGKKAAIAVPFEDKDPATADLIVKFFKKSLSYLEMKFAGQVLAPGVGAKGEIMVRSRILAEAFDLGRSL
jgi:multimeric flavodoxin WrbA